ncbi:MAG: response regulator [Pirellulales bacterium]
MTKAISVFIADDHTLVRAGLRLLLSSHADIHVVGECGTHQELLTALASRQEPVDVVTLDLTMPGGSPSFLIQDVVRHHPQTRIVVLTMHEDPSYARMAIAAGASAYVVKSAADTELVTAIRTVARGGMHSSVSTIVPEPRKQASVRDGGRPAIDTLSDREREVLVFIAQGHTNQQIADKLFLSVKTVESYRARLMTKLGLKDRAELTRFAMETGLFDQGGRS